MKKILINSIIVFCLVLIPNYARAEIKTDYATTTVDTTGVNRGTEEAIKYTSNIKSYAPTEKAIPFKEVGFWTALFFVVVYILYTFVAR